jgi:uncharacterized damage-inducible protein DinB
MFTTIDEFLRSWEHESGATTKMLAELTDESLTTAAAPGERPLGRVVWHIIQSIPEMMGRTGLSVAGPAQDAAPFKTAEELKAAYDEASSSLVSEMKAKWLDTDLLAVDDMYGEQWARGTTLGVLILHQAHHRGQLTTLMRVAGLKVPGPYGPAREEWVNYGMPPQE